MHPVTKLILVLLLLAAEERTTSHEHSEEEVGFSVNLPLGIQIDAEMIEVDRSTAQIISKNKN
jgi:hypothetical protein